MPPRPIRARIGARSARAPGIYVRETVTFAREYHAPGRRRPSRFAATMVVDPERAIVVDDLGTHQHLAVDLSLAVEPDGSCDFLDAGDGPPPHQLPRRHEARY